MDEGARLWLTRVEGKLDTHLRQIVDLETRLGIGEERQSLQASNTKALFEKVAKADDCIHEVKRNLEKHTLEERADRRFQAGIAAAIGAGVALIPTILLLLDWIGK